MNYIHHADVTKHKADQPPVKEVDFFGSIIQVYDDAWRNHLHVVPTYRCNAWCEFCIEKHSKCEEGDLYDRMKGVIAEMQKADILHTISFTGGEPGLFPEYLGSLVGLVPGNAFKTVNTNGHNVGRLCQHGFDWINVSRHYINDKRNRDVFGCRVPALQEFLELDKGRSKIRFQAVVNEATTVEAYLKLIEVGYCDDVSFRSRMLDGSQEARDNHQMYLALIDEALNMGSSIVTQEIQDYYIYEVHDIGGKQLTFSYSNMEYALAHDRDSPTNIVREFILRPDGSLSGSWDPAVKPLLPPHKRSPK